ncbi:MAG: DNA repair protein RecN [gamma proteobacterium symbiont of Taylorina sp.]|nr:DNA repair protein RecN [gamma proteobacterium symbiont of Taylorina sp.]
MLNHITISNLAVVDTLELELESGLTVLTGETGAGKSILIDALGLVLGDRAEAASIRYGAERADIVAEFDSQKILVEQWLKDNELDSNEQCIIRRTINAKGRSRGFINGYPVPLQVLRELGEKLVNIHGQNTHQALLKKDEQRLLLDNFANLGSLRKTLNQHYQQWKSKYSEHQRLKDNSVEREAKLDLLQFQVQELNELDLQKNEFKILEEEHNKLSHANRLIEISQAVYAQLSADEQSNISYQVNHCLNEINSLSELDNSLLPISEMLNSALIQVDEASSELHHYLESIEIDPQRLRWLDTRIANIHDLSRKHRVETHSLYDHLEHLKQELKQLKHADNHLDELFKELKAIQKDYFLLAHQLTEKRSNASRLLSQQVMQHIHELGMEHCVFEIQPLAIESEQPQLHGMEVIEFYVSTNSGQPLRPLSKVVSGGELSRISLAIQVVTAQFSDIPTLIFDEVDVGIGGGIAEMVGKKLSLLGQNAQILCVTHQAQVACNAHQHLNVYKQTIDNNTSTFINSLSEQDKIEELARMMGGVNITEQTRSHAHEMRQQARSN